MTGWRLSAGASVVCVLMLSAISGCADLSPEVVAARAKFVLSASPGEQRGIAWIRKDLNEGTIEDPADIIVRGRIYAGDVPPWETGEAAFILTDITGHDGDDKHDPYSCPYCSEKIEDHIAMVRFQGDDGVLQVDTRELFGVSEKQVVVIRGKGTIGDDNMLEIDADGIYIEPR